MGSVSVPPSGTAIFVTQTLPFSLPSSSAIPAVRAFLSSPPPPPPTTTDAALLAANIIGMQSLLLAVENEMTDRPDVTRQLKKNGYFVLSSDGVVAAGIAVAKLLLPMAPDKVVKAKGTRPVMGGRLGLDFVGGEKLKFFLYQLLLLCNPGYERGT